MSNEELMKILKSINKRKNGISREQILKNAKKFGVETDVLLNAYFKSHTYIASEEKWEFGRFVPQASDVFKLSANGKDALANCEKENKAVKRANLAIVISGLAAFTSFVSVVYTILISG